MWTNKGTILKISQVIMGRYIMQRVYLENEKL
jgi:hypothetical protein